MYIYAENSTQKKAQYVLIAYYKHLTYLLKSNIPYSEMSGFLHRSNIIWFKYMDLVDIIEKEDREKNSNKVLG